MPVKITKSFVDTITSAKKDQFFFDSNLVGFGLKMNSGGKKSYIVQYRINGRKRRYTIGSHGTPWTPDRARTEAKRLLGMVASGEDPAEQKATLRQDLTVAQLCDLYLAEGCATKKQSTIDTDKGRIKRHIKPLIGTRKLKTVNNALVDKMMVDVANGKTAINEKTGLHGRAIVRGGKGTASKCVALLSAMFNFAIRRDLISENPAHGVKKFKENKRDRFLSPEEFKRLAEAIENVGEVNPFAIAIIRVLMLTGLRKNEAALLRWQDILPDHGFILIPDSKTGRKYIPLTEPVMNILDDLPRIEGNNHVFAGRGDKPYQGYVKVWRSIRAKAGLEDVRLHDLRHSFASVGVNSHMSLPIIGKLLGHNDQATTERYAHIANNPAIDAAEAIAAEIAGYTGLTKNKGNHHG